MRTQVLFFSECDAAYRYLTSIEEKPFLIISEMNLPRMNGIELKKKIDATDYLQRVVILFVFMTTSDEQQRVENAYRITNLQGFFKKETQWMK